MFYVRDTYARAWQVVRKTDKYTDVRISTSEKDQEGNKLFSTWFVRCVGAAHNKAKKLSEGDYIKILKAKIQNIDRKDENGNYKPYGSCLDVIVFDFEMNNNDSDDEKSAKSKSSKTSSTKKSSKKSKQEEEDDDDIDMDEVPF